MIASLCKHGLELDAEKVLGILCIEERSHGGDTVGAETCSILKDRLDAQHVDAGTQDESASLVVKSGVNLGSVAVFDVARALPFGAVGSILHLPESRCGE